MAQVDDSERTRTMRDHLLGLWAAGQLGLNGGDALVYAAEVTQADVEGGCEAMVTKIVTDFTREHTPIQAETVEHFLRGCEAEAARRLGQGH